MAGCAESMVSTFELKQFLGAGYEGSVYVAVKDGKNYVLKVFHRPWSRELARNLIAYSERVGPNDAGFFPIHLIVDGEHVLGLYYEFMPLFRIPFGGRFSERIAQALFAQFCFSQAYLLREHSMYMVDDAMQFLLSEDGGLYYVDYGKRIVLRDDPFFLTRGCAPFSFLEALFGLNGVAIDRAVARAGFDYGRPCHLVSGRQYDALARDQRWTAPIVEMCRRAKADQFLDFRFYDQLGGMFPRTIRHPGPLVLADKVLFRPIRLLRTKTVWSRAWTKRAAP